MLAFLELQLDPGWKTYWRVPGDAGVPPTFEWTPASNVASATVYYPAPHRMADQGGEAIGYQTSVIFPIRLVPRDAKAPMPAVLNFSYGICKNICVPAEAQLTGECHGISPEIAASVEAVPRAPGQRRDTDPKLVSIAGSAVGTPPRLIVDVDYGPAAGVVDIFAEADGGLYVPQPARAVPDAKGRAHFTIDLSKAIDVKDLLGHELRLTMVSEKGASEAVWRIK
jgi:DsbC/DsbD-like thiol-disulfide interchange protein